MDALLTFTDPAGNRFEVYRDEDAESPREWDNLGVIYSNHRRYSPDGHSIEEICPNGINKTILNRDYIWKPIWGYEHSGLTITTGPRDYPFNDEWDSGLFGIIAVPRAKVRKEYGVRRITASVRKKALAALRDEIKTLDMFFNGDVYGFIKFNPQNEEIDGCWGLFYDSLDSLKHDLLADYGEDA